MPNNSLLPFWLEWEILQNEYSIANPSIEKKLPGTPDTIRIWRDDNYKIIAEIEGTSHEFWFDDSQNFESSGLTLPSFNIMGKNNHDTEEYELKYCYLGGRKSIQHKNFLKTFTSTFQTELTIQEIRILRQKGKQPVWLTEWYLNGPSMNDFLYRVTERITAKSYTRKRDVLKNKIEQFDTAKTDELAKDFVFIKCSDFGFILYKIPAQFGPKWSNNLGIEYRNEFGRIPDEEERVAIGEIISFILGKHILRVGYSSFDESGHLIEQGASNPWGDNVKHVCQSGHFCPIHIHHFETIELFESVLPLMIEKYFELRKSLQLNEVLWRFWIGSELPLGENIPIMASGIEILSKRWFESTKSNSKGKYLEKDLYDSLTQNEFLIIKEKLQNHKHGDKILNKLQNCYNMGSNERLENFFEELNIPLGALERTAMKYRNIMIHDSIDYSRITREELIKMYLAYTCLTHRVLLKVLGYDGTYLDYSMKERPEKPLNQSVGE